MVCEWRAGCWAGATAGLPRFIAPSFPQQTGDESDTSTNIHQHPPTSTPNSHDHQCHQRQRPILAHRHHIDSTRASQSPPQRVTWSHFEAPFQPHPQTGVLSTSWRKRGCPCWTLKCASAARDWPRSPPFCRHPKVGISAHKLTAHDGYTPRILSFPMISWKRSF